VSEEEGMAKPSDTQLAFTLRLFDLNQNGTLTTDEMLTSLALDAVVGLEGVRSARYTAAGRMLLVWEGTS
jgi:Ca2+-binding EF-hand superfamily protein